MVAEIVVESYKYIESHTLHFCPLAVDKNVAKVPASAALDEEFHLVPRLHTHPHFVTGNNPHGAPQILWDITIGLSADTVTRHQPSMQQRLV